MLGKGARLARLLSDGCRHSTPIRWSDAVFAKAANSSISGAAQLGKREQAAMQLVPLEYSSFPASFRLQRRASFQTHSDAQSRCNPFNLRIELSEIPFRFRADALAVS